MSGTYVGTVVSPPPSTGSIAEYTPLAKNIGTVVSPPPSTGSIAEYREAGKAGGWSVGISMSRDGWSVS